MHGAQKIVKAVIYARVSDSPTAVDSESCEAQIEYCMAWCKAQQYHVIGVYSDKAVSGAVGEDQRPALAAALREVYRYKAVLVCYSLSRFSRHILDCLTLVEKIRQAKGHLACIKEGIATNSIGGEFVFHIFAALYHFERKCIAQRTSDAMKQYQAAGRRMSRFPPFGWQIDPENPKRLIPNPAELETVKKILQLRQEGKSQRQIAVILNDYPEHSPRQGVWCRQKVQLVLRKARYHIEKP